MTRWLVRLYPRAWRRRYEAEFVELLTQRSLTTGETLDVIRGALDAHYTAWQRRSGIMIPVMLWRGLPFIAALGTFALSYLTAALVTATVRQTLWIHFHTDGLYGWVPVLTWWTCSLALAALAWTRTRRWAARHSS